MSRGPDETPHPSVKNSEWCGKWENMGQTLKEFSDPVEWDFPREQIQNPAEVEKYLKEKCHNNSKEEKLIAISWALAYAYRTLLNTVGQQTEARGQGDKPAAIPVTQAADNTPVTQAVAKTDSELKPLAVAARKKKSKTNRPGTDNDDPGKRPSKLITDTKARVRATEARSEATTESYSLKDLRGLKKDYTQRPDESIINYLPGLSENPSAVRLLKVEEQRVPIATSTVHRRQYRTDRDAVIPIHKIIRKLESQRVVSKTHSPFNSPIWPVRKSEREWKLTVDYRGLNEVTPPLSAAVPNMLKLQYELESKATKWYATIDITNAFFSIPLAAECRPQFAFTWRGVQYTWNRLPQGWKHNPTICHGLIQAALEKSEAPEHLQYIDDIIKSKVKGPAREIQFLRVKWQDERRQIPTDIINKITAMSPPTNKKKTQAFLSAIGF
ncbi:Gag-Pol polyprotein [Lonchura striata]|uniref:ribonuclease H n=1 Tax=Lonchura striata TaxID=40157 RepID=A0A218UP31_9PASE|nr:Gag-Pol polyprotein [Lonchura striata domestica]